MINGGKTFNHSARTDYSQVVAQKRVVSILYADIVQSTQIVSSLDANDVSEYLDPIIQYMRQSVHHFDGRIVRVEGDGVKAMFGPIESREDHAVRAVLTGQMLISLIENHAKLNTKYPVRVRVGIHSGYTIVRWQSNDFGGGLDTVGSAAHIAAKIQANAPVNTVYVSEDTAHLLSDYFEFKQDKVIHLGENSDPVAAFLLHKDTIEEASANLSISGLPTYFFGREAELSKFKKWFDFSHLDRPETVTIFGEAGIGKSRLLYEINHMAKANDLHVVKAGGLQVFQHTPFRIARLLLSQLSKLYAEVLDENQNETLTDLEVLAIDKITSTVGPEFSKWDLPEGQKLDHLINAAGKILQGICSNRPLILVIEDMHAIDLDSMVYLETVMRTHNNKSLMLIVTARPTQQALRYNFAKHVMHLEPLSDDMAKSLIFNVAGVNADINFKDKARQIIDRVNGSPLALIELTKLLLNQKGSAGGGEVIPMTLEPVLRNRLDQLSPDARDLTKYASLYGRESRLSDLKALLGWSDDRIKLAYEEAVEEGIFSSNIKQQPTFIHDLFQEVCENGIVRQERRKIHSQIYQLMVEVNSKNSNEGSYQLLAHHAFQGGHAEKSLGYMWKAISAANRSAAYQTALNLYNRTVEICDFLEDGLRQKAKFAILSFEACHHLNTEDSLLPVFQQVLDRHDEQLSIEEKALIKSHIGLILWVSGNPKSALSYSGEALELVKQSEHPGLKFYAAYVHACAEFATGHVRSSISRLKEQIAIYSGDYGNKRWGQSISVPGIISRTFCSWYAVDMGDIALAKKLTTEAYALENLNPHSYGKLLCDLSYGYVLYRTGEFSKGAEVLTGAYEIAHKSHHSSASMAAGRAALCLIEINELDQAEAILSAEIETGRIEHIRNSNRFYVLKGEACLLNKRGQFRMALQKIDAAIEAAEVSQDPVHQAYGYWKKFQFLSTMPDKEIEATHCHRAALHLARQCELSGLIAICEAEI